MRYYHYLSTNKVEMLYDQISEPSSSVSHEIGFDIKMAKGIRKSSVEAAEPSIYKKLEQVEAWIYDHEPVGTIDDPQPWISARVQLLMVTDPDLVVESDVDRPEQPEPASVLFAGKSETGSIVLLGGSASNLVSGAARGVEPGHYSNAHWLMRTFNRIINPRTLPPAVAAELLPSNPQAWQYAEEIADGWLYGGQNNLGECELLAKRVATIVHEEKYVTMTTPLYVALMD